MSRSSGTATTDQPNEPRGRRRRRPVLVSAGVALLMALAACSSSKSSTPSNNASSSSPAATTSTAASSAPSSTAPSAPASSAPSAPASSPAAAPISLTQGYNSTPDEAYLPIVAAMDALSKAGTYDVKPSITFGSDDLALQALSQGKIQFLSDSLPSTASALAKLPNIVVIGARANNQWDFLAKTAITSCTQLNGKKLGLFSSGGVSTAYVNIYFAANCPNVKPQIIITADSTLRRQALLAGQLDATPLQASDAVQVLATASDKFHELVNFATSENTIGRDIILTTKDMIAQHPDEVEAFLTAQLTAIRGYYTDPTSAATQTTSLLKDSVSGDVSGVANYFVNHKLWCANGGLGDANLADSLTTFGKGGFLPTSVTVAQLVDDAPMKAVLAKLGTSTATTC